MRVGTAPPLPYPLVQAIVVSFEDSLEIAHFFLVLGFELFESLLASERDLFLLQIRKHLVHFVPCILQL